VLLVLTAALVLVPQAVTSSAAVPAPAFVQQSSGHGASRQSLAVTPTSNITTGNRLVVEVGIWSSASATALKVSDSAGNSYVELTHFTAADATEMSVWSAPITVGGGTKPTLTATATSVADIGMTVNEYSGLSTVADATVVDTSAQAIGKTVAAQAVGSAATSAASVDNELAMGFYVDSGFSDTLSAGPGFTVRSNVSPNGDMELLTEDAVVAAGATPAATINTGAKTYWLAATILLRPATGTASIPGAPTAVTATASSGSAAVTWTVPFTGGLPLTSYVVTPYIGTVAQASTTITGSPPSPVATIGGLTNGTSYTFVVTATNSLGTGPASSPSNAVTPGAVPLGQWSALQTMPIVALSNILMKNGSLLSWDGWQQPQPSVVWNPNTPGVFSTINAPDSVFCDGAVQLPDGRVVVVGGYGGLSTGQAGIVDTNIYNPTTSSWTRVANMHFPRWYPDLTELADGRLVAISGNSTDTAHWADTPEVYDPAANTWTTLSAVSTPQVHEEEYPFSYLVPNGSVFTIGPSEDNSFLLNVANQTWTATGGASGIRNGSSVMYQPGKILYTGGASDINNPTPAQANASIIDLTAATPKWQAVAPMGNARIYHTLTMLADGRVLAIGGSNTSDQKVVTTGVLPTEEWDPTTQTWTADAPIAASRNYHSTALLLPDGRVLVAGGGHPNGLGDAGQFSSQIFSPSYLFNGPRPTITSAPSQANYGATMTVTTPDAASIKSVNLVSLGADTHQSDMGQHFVPLSFTAGSGSLNISAPSSGALAPPGNYMLFIVNSAGVPSVSAMVTVGQAPGIPAAPTAVTATAGNQSATVSWTAPANSGSPITGYTVTPYAGTTPSTPTTVTGSPAPTTVTVSGLSNGTAYTFVVTATNGVGTGPPSVASNAVTPVAPSAPSAPTGVTATAGNQSATVSWTAPSGGGSTITSYAVTPYVGSTALAATTVSGSPAPTTATVSGLSNGTAYTFVVTATNGVGTSPPSVASNAVTPVAVTTPGFVQQVNAHGANRASLGAALASNVTAGNRLVVEVGTWANASATTSAVTDSAGNTYTELMSVVASDKTEMSVWTAPITAGGGTKPTVTATTTKVSDIGIAVSEYSGLSTAGGTAVLDQSAHASAKTTTAAAVSSGSTPGATLSNELAIGFYLDSGFSDTLSAGPGYTPRSNISPAGDIELLTEDAIIAAGANPAASINTGPNTTWIAATLTFKPS
jgi:hypothetical protein